VSSSTEASKRASSKTSKPAGRASTSFVRRLLADTRGTATTETVIMLPMFIIVWGCIFFVFVFFQRTIEMRSLTRRDTWLYAYTSCETNPGGGTELSAPDEARPIDLGSMASTVMRFLPGFTIGRSSGARTASVSRPQVLGGGSIGLRDRMWVLCNEQPASVLSTVIDLAREFVGSFF
jgi:hypothetical protein